MMEPPRQRFLGLPGLASLRGRYIYIAIGLSVLLAVVAVLGWGHVERTSRAHVTKIQHRAQASDAVSDLVQQSRVLETSVQRFILLPTEANEAAVERAFTLQDAATTRLRDSTWVGQDISLQQLMDALRADSKRMREEVTRLIEDRLGGQSWFPAMTIMQERMWPHNVAFMAAVNLAIDEAADKANELRTREVYRLLVEVRHAWHKMVAEFRLYVSNRFGVFSTDLHNAMRARAENVATYAIRVADLLDQLNVHDDEGGLQLQASQSLEEMRWRRQEWLNAYDEVTDILSSDAWRRDLTVLHEAIDPLLEQIQQRLSTVQLELGVESAKDITDLAQLARRLSGSVMVLAIGGVLVIVLGFFAFRRSLLTPIELIARALKADAEGERDVVVPASTVEEVRDLTHAFGEMRKQVRLREKNLEFMAHHDALTGLPNRVLFRDRLQQALARGQRDEHIVGLMFLDLDRFKQINDSLGHDAGDRLLQMVGERLAHCMRSSDTVARLGGDEFAVVIEGIADPEQVAEVAQKIRDAFVVPFSVDGYELHVTFSIGLAVSPMNDRDTDTLIKDADIAMYHAKDHGRDRFEFYSAEMTTRVTEHLAMETQLRRALELDQFEVHYQPIVDVPTRRIIGCEALLRWHHPERGVIPTAQFLPILEETGLIKPVTNWVLKEACSHYRAWTLAGFSMDYLSVNLSGALLRGGAVVAAMMRSLSDCGTDPKNVVVEVTEDTLIQDLRAAEAALQTLSEMGVRVALDDFGTRQSSLSHLRYNPIDFVKIDRDFVRDVPADPNDSQLVAAIIAMAHQLGIRVIAEGVETLDQLMFLRRHKCDAMQGYLFSRPLSAAAMLELLKAEIHLAGSAVR